jgi:predicted branched-subunit amino acid permease
VKTPESPQEAGPGCAPDRVAGPAVEPATRRVLPSGAQLRDILLVCLADGIVGVSFGATSVGGGLPWWVPVALSVLVFAGGSQIAAVGVVLGGGSPVAAVLAGAVLNTRLFPYGLAVADVVDGPWWRRLLGTHVITDESVAFALRQSSRERRRSAFWTCGGLLFAVWNVTVLLGVALGSAVRNTNAFGLDATFPAVMLALALPTLTAKSTRVAAGTGAVIAVALTPVLPAGLPLLAALAGLGTRWGGWRNWRTKAGWGGGRITSRARGPHVDEAGDPLVAGAAAPIAGAGVVAVDHEELRAGGTR